MSHKCIFIALVIQMTGFLFAQSVEIRINANNDPRIEMRNLDGNTFIGSDAGHINIGSNNTALGDSALFSNINGNHNTANGYKALYSNTTGLRNTGSGYATLNANSSGFSNTAVGSGALSFNADGDSNTGVGVETLFVNVSSDNNTATGYHALFYNTANDNTACGSEALLLNTTGFENVAIGYQALYNNTIGFRNIAAGHDALLSNTTGDQRTAYGHSSNSVGADYNNTTGLGYNADCTATNQVRIGNSSVTSIGGYAPWSDVSDSRFKSNISENVIGLEFINTLRPITYTLDLHAIDDWWADNYGQRDVSLSEIGYEKEKIVYTGFIAQEVEEAARSLGYEFSGVDAPKNNKDYYGLRYSTFVVPLVKAVQEQQMQIEVLRRENACLKEEHALRYNAQQQQINSLHEMMEELKAAIEMREMNPLSD